VVALDSERVAVVNVMVVDNQPVDTSLVQLLSKTDKNTLRNSAGVFLFLRESHALLASNQGVCYDEKRRILA